MEDSFRVRVDKIFGSLTVDNDATWSLTDEEVKRRQWNRHVEQDNNIPSQSLDLVVHDEIEQDAEKEIESQIGRDLTLDLEEDEDKYDKLAIGAEEAGDRFYMKELNHDDYGIEELNTYGELPTSFGEVSKDPRANQMAAKIRLKEDDEASGNFDASQPLGDYISTNMETEDVIRDELNSDIQKSILKKRENLAESKSEKRVLFMCESKSNGMQLEPSTQDGAVDHVSDPTVCFSGVPDYIRNPSKYTCYTFDDSSDDIDDQSNKSAFLEFFESLRKRDVADSSSTDDSNFDISKPVVFTRKTKQAGALTAKRTASGYNKVGSDVNISIGVTVEDVEESEISAMEEDEVPLTIDTNVKSQKPGRKYRAKITEMDD